MKTQTRRTFLQTAVAGVSTVAITGRAAANEYGARKVTLVVPFGPGGSADRMARGIQPYLSEELGVPVSIVNREGGGGVLGHTWYLSQPDDGSSFLVTAATPHLANHVITKKGKFTWDQYSFINAQWQDFYILAVPKDQPYENIDELIADLRIPGKVSSAILSGDGGHLSTLLLMQQLGIPKSNLRMVTYDGGGGIRTALGGNQVSMSVISGRGSEVIRDAVRPLAVFLDRRTPEWDAPTINEALQSHNAEVPILTADVRTMICAPSFPEKHPDRYNAFLMGYERTLARADCQAALAEGGIGGDWMGPDATSALLQRNYAVLSEHAGLLTVK